MGLFNNTLNADSTTEFTTKFDAENEQGAWIAVLVACANIDEKVTDTEVQVLTQNFVNKTIFDGHDLPLYYKPALVFCNLYGSKALIDSSASLISEEAKECLLCQALELMSNDGIVEPEEKAIFKYLNTALKVPEDTTEKIIDVYKMRNKWNKEIVE